MAKIILEFNNTTEPSRGKLLVSEPFIPDPYFKRSVVLLTEYNKEGSVGFILNKITGHKLQKVIGGFPQFNGALYFGGPVNKDQLFYIHTAGKTIEGSIQIKKGLYWGGDFDTVKDMIKTKKINETEIRFFIGYSGWEAEQLEREIKEKTWMVSDTTVLNVMKADTGKMWSDTLKTLGADYAAMANFPEDPILN